MFRKILDMLVGRPEPSDERLIRVEQKVSDIDVRLNVLELRAKVKQRRGTTPWPG